MLSRIRNTINLLHNMGWRYTQYRVTHELLLRTGLLKYKFPVKPAYKQYITLQQWKEQQTNFFFADKESLRFKKELSPELERRFNLYQQGKFIFFNNIEFELGKNYDWITNPDTGYKYDASKHWTAIADYSKEAGDIKYVWEKSRFSFLYDIIRYDYHFNSDCAAAVFAEIISWIKANPVNCGPNYRCSQEISLRVLNWTFALHYYKNSTALTEEIFNEIQFAIYWHMDHVYKHINFSRIAVRNNHAITETLALYLAGLLYSMYPGAADWKQKGRAWFEEEIAYQVYEDGTFLQFSMNYHRVVVQLLTWAIVLAGKNGEQFNAVVYGRAKKSMEFLRVCMNDTNGWLPHYGNDDGALFFKMNDKHYRDYRPQLQALATALETDLCFMQSNEDAAWYGLKKTTMNEWQPANGIHQFNTGGYYIIREADTLTFIRCGNHKDRPLQADNLHLDIWHKGENMLTDAGSYKYNTDEKTLKYFMGTASHNTVMLNNEDQMLKGSRFIWYNWTQCTGVQLTETEEAFCFKGTISAFAHIKPGILHTREIIKTKGKSGWIIKDTITGKPASVLMKQLWHLPLQHSPVLWNSVNENEEQAVGQEMQGFISGLYGTKEPCEIIVFQTFRDAIFTKFEIKP